MRRGIHQHKDASVDQPKSTKKRGRKIEQKSKSIASASSKTLSKCTVPISKKTRSIEPSIRRAAPVEPAKKIPSKDDQIASPAPVNTNQPANEITPEIGIANSAEKAISTPCILLIAGSSSEPSPVVTVAATLSGEIITPSDKPPLAAPDFLPNPPPEPSYALASGTLTSLPPQGTLLDPLVASTDAPLFPIPVSAEQIPIATLVTKQDSPPIAGPQAEPATQTSLPTALAPSPSLLPDPIIEATNDGVPSAATPPATPTALSADASPPLPSLPTVPTVDPSPLVALASDLRAAASYTDSLPRTRLLLLTFLTLGVAILPLCQELLHHIDAIGQLEALQWRTFRQFSVVIQQRRTELTALGAKLPSPYSIASVSPALTPFTLLQPYATLSFPSLASTPVQSPDLAHQQRQQLVHKTSREHCVLKSRIPRPLGPPAGQAPRMRRPERGLMQFQRLRLPNSPPIAMRTVHTLGPVQLQMPVDEASLPQATTLLKGKTFAYRWRLGEAHAHESVDESGRRWVRVFVGSEQEPSVVVAVQAIPVEMMQQLEVTSATMVSKWEQRERDPLRYTQSTVLGYWRPYRRLLAPSKPSLGALERQWLQTQQPLFNHVSSLLEASLPAVHARLKQRADKLFPPFRLGVYPTMAFNVSVCTEHIDVQDVPELRCAVLPWGRYTEGGALLMPELGLRIALRPGDVVFFPSAHYLHENEPLGPGEQRRSLVFFAHSDVMQENTEFPSAEDIACLAEGREPSWKREARLEREQMKEESSQAAAHALLRMSECAKSRGAVDKLSALMRHAELLNFESMGRDDAHDTELIDSGMVARM